MKEETPDISLDYIAAGGNRNPAAADWTPGLLAFGAGKDIALWDPEDSRHRGISALVKGHTDVVNAVRIYERSDQKLIISGGADKTVRIWKPTHDILAPYEQSCCLTGHEGSVNTISVLPKKNMVVTGAADGIVKIWAMKVTGAKLVQSISLKPRFLPLATAMVALVDGAIVLAVAGTTSAIKLYAQDSASADFVLQATFTGHEGWIRSLDFARDGNDALLASASQDKYIRLWRFQKDSVEPAPPNGTIDLIGAAAPKKSLSNKAHLVGSVDAKYNVTFEALLIGHEDWIYTARWAPTTASNCLPTLLSASADNSLAIWTADQASGVWICDTRLGEISSQKGSTSATGSTGGFWVGMWQPDGQSVVSLGRTGSWRIWSFNHTRDTWEQQVGISGHTQEVQGMAWSPDGSYLLTTGSDQTTRLFAEWKQDHQRSWHEFARPQIHGYDLNCIDSLNTNRFISGADEKLLRVFNKPKAIDHLLSKLSGMQSTVAGGIADAANIPVLGLSNKAIAAVADDEQANGAVNRSTDEREVVDPASNVHRKTLDLDHPPLEDHLARHTLWPEHEKLYGHGYEISAVAASHDGTLVATACKASSLDHAVIRLYETTEWREVKPPLTAHSLTVTALAFSGDDKFLLSVGRDRMWAVFERDEESTSLFKLVTSNPKGHARMILDCAWAPTAAGVIFATAGRDKLVKMWKLAAGKADCVTSVQAGAAVTAVAFSSVVNNNVLRLSFGTDDGGIQVVDLDDAAQGSTRIFSVPTVLCPSGAVNCLRWRPTPAEGSDTKELAVASDDSSVRISKIKH